MFGFFKESFSRIKNPVPRKFEGDFRFTVFALVPMLIVSGLVIGAVDLLSGGLGAPGGSSGAGLDAFMAARIFSAIALAALCYALVPRWVSLIPALFLGVVALVATPGILGRGDLAAASPSLGSAVLAVFLAILSGPTMQVVPQWDKAVVLRMGAFRRLKGPGVFFLMPVVDRCADIVDTRIRVTDFSAEKIITKDTVPIYVDALAFWMIWDAKKAILEVEDFMQAVTLSAQAALRDTVGRYELSGLLAEREKLYGEIQSILDAKTNPWGISILSVEFVDIRLPKDLEDVMSRQAQAEREKKARLLLGEAELEVAKKFEKAAEAYRGNPEALNLRAMTMVYDGMKARGSLVLVPSSALDSMNLGSVLGSAALASKSGSAPSLRGEAAKNDESPDGDTVDAETEN